MALGRRSDSRKMGQDEVMDSDDESDRSEDRHVKMREMDKVEPGAPDMIRKKDLLSPAIPGTVDQDLLHVRVVDIELIKIIRTEKDDIIKSRLSRRAIDLDYIVDHFLGITPQTFADGAVEAGVDAYPHVDKA